MPELITTIPIVRESVLAILRTRLIKPETVKKGKLRPGKIQFGWGSGFCITADRYVATAYHNLNAGQPPNSADKFYAFVVPQNADIAYHFPVVGFPIQRQEIDMAVLELGPCAIAGISIPAMPISFNRPPDGSHVMTLGFPAPEIGAINVDAQGNFQNGQFFLKSHANEGIVAAQYVLGGIHVYELNIGWHHGESGGPIVTLTDPPAAFSMMQQYRNVQSPHGVIAGPRRGCALSMIRDELAALGVNGI